MRVVVAAVALAALLPSTARADTHKDEKLGFSIVYPRKWKIMPVAADSRWLVARFQSHREYEHSDAKTNFWTRHEPKLDVVIIPLSAGEDRGATVKKTKDGVSISEAAPYRDLKEYMDKTLRNEGGFHFSAEDEVEINGRKVMQYEVTIDKLARVPKRVWGWAYYGDDAIYGVVADSLMAHEDKIKPDIMKAFRSVKLFQRSGTLPSGERTGSDITLRGFDTDADLTEEDIADRRDKGVDREVSRIVDGLPKDWTVKETKHFVIVSHADKRYTKEVARHCEAFRGWLDKKFDYLGSGHRGRVIVRICADSDERSNYLESKGWFSDTYEVVTYKDRDGWSDWAMESLNRGIWNIWFSDTNRDLAVGAPRWISSGLADVMERASSKGKKIEFKADTWDKSRINELRRDDKLLPASAFFNLTTAELWADWENGRQVEFFVNYLLVGAGSKGKYKSVFPDYVKNLIVAMDEAGGDEEYIKLLETVPKTEAEETELFRKRAEYWTNQERTMLDQLRERTFGDWAVKDWERLSAAYWKEL